MEKREDVWMISVLEGDKNKVALRVLYRMTNIYNSNTGIIAKVIF